MKGFKKKSLADKLFAPLVGLAIVAIGFLGLSLVRNNELSQENKVLKEENELIVESFRNLKQEQEELKDKLNMEAMRQEAEYYLDYSD